MQYRQIQIDGICMAQDESLLWLGRRGKKAKNKYKYYSVSFRIVRVPVRVCVFVR